MDEQAVALDISKAFNRVWYNGLFHKPKSHGIPGPVFCFISFLLSNRQLQMVPDGKSLKEDPANSGVPQGSILVPTLFLL